MRTEKKRQQRKVNLFNQTFKVSHFFFAALLAVLTVIVSKPASAHCDSYDGPVITDAQKALETNNPEPVLKWISKDQEKEVIPLFNKTVALKNGDREIYEVIEKYFFETLVRLHRETEGAPYTGLKAPGTTKQIIQMSDHALSSGDIDDLVTKLNKHIGSVISEKYHKAAELNQKKNESVETGRAFVEAYVDYTHTLEAIHDVLEHGGGSHAGH
jgi:hypothetical protein